MYLNRFRNIFDRVDINDLMDEVKMLFEQKKR